MIDHDNHALPAGEDAYLEARAFALSLVAIRRAQGKPNPGDFTVGTPEWAAVVQDFAADILSMPPHFLMALELDSRSSVSK